MNTKLQFLWINCSRLRGRHPTKEEEYKSIKTQHELPLPIPLSLKRLSRIFYFLAFRVKAEWYASGDLTLTLQYFCEVKRVCLFEWRTDDCSSALLVNLFVMTEYLGTKCLMQAKKFKIVWLLTQTTWTNSKKLRLNGIVAMSIDKLLSAFKN